MAQPTGAEIPIVNGSVNGNQVTLVTERPGRGGRAGTAPGAVSLRLPASPLPPVPSRKAEHPSVARPPAAAASFWLPSPGLPALPFTASCNVCRREKHL